MEALAAVSAEVVEEADALNQGAGREVVAAAVAEANNKERCPGYHC